MADNEPLETRRRRAVIRPAIKSKAPPAEEETPELDFTPLFGCEAVEVAANALITSVVSGVAEPDLVHTGAIRQAVQLLHNIGQKPDKKRNYKELHKLLDLLEAYNATSPDL